MSLRSFFPKIAILQSPFLPTIKRKRVLCVEHIYEDDFYLIRILAACISVFLDKSNFCQKKF